MTKAPPGAEWQRKRRRKSRRAKVAKKNFKIASERHCAVLRQKLVAAYRATARPRKLLLDEYFSDIYSVNGSGVIRLLLEFRLPTHDPPDGSPGDDVTSQGLDNRAQFTKTCIIHTLWGTTLSRKTGLSVGSEKCRELIFSNFWRNFFVAKQSYSLNKAIVRLFTKKFDPKSVGAELFQQNVGMITLQRFRLEEEMALNG
ncbi:hypothetical protein K0M31_003804 [Melipona bicolor]|uniref:Uncharacterized protein n=1 Tax=Melipona bicolor TaxID=60889 RepID=A0AA40KNY0_9HYME|nr:hypothetical protein K0M31_003804 [Melipona bicolor]